MNSYWKLTLLCCLLHVNSYAQQPCELQLSGKIIDEHDGSALSFSSVFLLNESRGVAADENGYFMLENLCAKRYRIVISHIGCEPDTVDVELKKSKTFQFYLEHHLEEIQAVEISGEQQGTQQQQQLSEDSYYANSGKAIAEILSEINGVSSYRTGANISKPVIGGFKNNRVQLINQGVQLQSQQWGDEHAPEIDPFSASEYTVVKGAGSVKYAGGAIGGYVVANPKPLPRQNGIGGEVNALYATNNRMGNASVMLEGNSKLLPEFSWRIQSSGKRSGNIKTPKYYQKNTGVEEFNGSADLGFFKEKWNFRFFYSQFNSEIGIFSGAHIGNLTDLRAAIERSEPRLEDQEGFSYDIRRPKQRIIHELSKGEFNYYSSHWGKLNFKFARQFNIREEFDKELPRNDELAALNLPEFSITLESYTANLNWIMPEKKNWNGELGIQYMDQENLLHSFTDFIPEYNLSTYSLFWVEQWQREKLNLEFGLRLDQQFLTVNKLMNRAFERFEHEYRAITANAGIGYQLGEYQKLNLNAVYVERPPAINELYSDGLHHGTASLERGEASLVSEKLYGINTTYTVEKKKWSFEIYGYLQYIEDFIYLRPEGLDLTIRGAFPSFQWSNANAFVRGIDQSVSYKFHPKIEIENQLSLLWGNNTSDDNFLINMPANRIETKANYSIKGGKTQTKLKAQIGHQWVMKQQRFNEDEIAEPPAGYSLVFATLSYSMNINKKHALEFGIRGDNLFNTVYRDYLNRFRFYSDEQGRNLTFRIKYNF